MRQPAPIPSAARLLPNRRRALRLLHASLVSAWATLLLILMMTQVPPQGLRTAAVWIVFLAATWLEYRFNDRKLPDARAPLSAVHPLLLGAMLAGSFPALLLAGYSLGTVGLGAALGGVIGLIHAAIRFRATPAAG